MARKENKLRPYRVDYFNIPEMKGDRALVRSIVIRAVTAKEAAEAVRLETPVGSPTTHPLCTIIIRSYRYYKTTPANKEVFKAVEDLFTEKKAIEVMEVVEKFRSVLSAKTEFHTTEVPATLPPNCGETLKVVPPTPDPVCPYGYTKEDDEAGRMTAHNCAIHTNTNQEPVDVIKMPDVLERINLDEAAPIIHPAPTAVTEETYQALTFPDKPVVPTQPAVFDDSSLVPTDGVLTSTDPGPQWLDSLPPREPDFIEEKMPLWLKLLVFGGVSLVAVILVIAILHCGH